MTERVRYQVAEATGKSRSALRSDYDVMGDMGDVAQKAREQTRVLFKSKPLTIQHVAVTMRRIAELKGVE